MKTVLSEIVSKPSVPAGFFRAFEAAVAPLDSAIGGVVDQLFTWHQRARDRQALGQLDEHMLHDIGLSSADVEREVSKPFWQS
jgi:uncharacterized protein YjiS (DUF1127 family)